MSVITFWSQGLEQTGKTSAIAAISTYMAIEHNYKILIISTGYNKKNMENCFWQTEKQKKSRGLFGPNTNVGLDDGIAGIMRIMRSNKLLPEIITNYTKIVFKERLEILPSFKGEKDEYKELKSMYPDIITLANSYYDLVFVDLDANELDEDIKREILNKSNLIVANLTQRLATINGFIELREQEPMFKSKKTLIMINRFDKFSKYSVKNISRYMGEKNKVLTMPYNTLFFEACDEAGVPDLFLRFRRIEEDDRNGFFIAEVKRASENIIYRLQDLQLR